MSLTDDERRERGWKEQIDGPKVKYRWAHKTIILADWGLCESEVDEIEAYADLRVSEALEEAATKIEEQTGLKNGFLSQSIRALKPRGSDGQPQG